MEHDALVSKREVGGLEGLYRAQGPRLWRALVAYSGDPEIASDAVAEASTRIIGHLNAYALTAAR